MCIQCMNCQSGHYSLFAAMKVKSKDKNRVLSAKEQAIYIEEAESRGLPKGWSVYWDNKKVSDICFFFWALEGCLSYCYFLLLLLL